MQSLLNSYPSFHFFFLININVITIIIIKMMTLMMMTMPNPGNDMLNGFKFSQSCIGLRHFLFLLLPSRPVPLFFFKKGNGNTFMRLDVKDHFKKIFIPTLAHTHTIQTISLSLSFSKSFLTLGNKNVETFFQ